MTIIVTYVEYPLLMQVSDRRLTWPDGSVADDSSTKTILWNRSWLLSYTGLARIKGKPTHQFIAEFLSSSWHELEDGYLDRTLERLLGSALSQAIREDRVPRESRRLAIVGAGWGVPWDVDEPPPYGVRPYIWHLSNFLDRDGAPENEVRDDFTLVIAQGRPLRKTERGILTHGQELVAKDWKSLCRRIEEVRRRRLGPATVARLMVDAVQQMTNPRVGEDVLVSSLPAPKKESGRIENRPPNLDSASFMYVPGRNAPFVQYGPVIVDGGNIILQLQIRYGPAVEGD